MSEVVSQMEPGEWMYWETIYRVQGFGESAADRRAAAVAATVANFSGRMTERCIDPAEFIPDPWDDAGEPMEVDVDDKLSQRFAMMAAAQARK